MRVQVKKVEYYTSANGSISALLRLTKKHIYKLENKQKLEFDSISVQYHTILVDNIGKDAILSYTARIKDKKLVAEIKKIKTGKNFKPATHCRCGGKILLLKENKEMSIFCSNLFCNYRYTTPILKIFKKALKDDKKFSENVVTFEKYIHNFPTGLNQSANIENIMMFIVLFRQVGVKDTNSRHVILKETIPGLEDVIFELEQKVSKYLENDVKKDFWDIISLPTIDEEHIKLLKKTYTWKNIVEGIKYEKMQKYWKSSSLQYKALINNMTGYKVIANELNKICDKKL